MTASPADGRTARSERTRATILDSLIALAREGDPAPTAARIAAGAGVTERTLFLHFVDLPTLHAAAARRHAEAVLARHRPVDAALPHAERLARFARQRARALEDIAAVRRVALRYGPAPGASGTRDRWTALGQAEIERVFARELGRCADRPTALAAARAATSSATWEHLRSEQGLTRPAAERAMTVLLRGALAQRASGAA